MAEGNGKKSVVLVHGILTDGSAWRKVIPLLQAHGLEVTAAQLPNSTLEEDIGTVRRTLDMQQGVVTLVGHSYAGMVISGSGKHERVANLVYIAALAPDEDETVAYLMTKRPGDYSLEPVTDQAGWSWPPRDVFANGVAQDADSADEALLWATRKSFGGVLFSSTVSDPVWKRKPSWYLAATEDRMLYIGTQRFMASRMNAQVHEIASSHLPQMAHPEAVAKIIIEAADAA
jgi:pimeloyl-ACP methyl ester carboxylesterase